MDIRAEMQEAMSKYCDLVWYARKPRFKTHEKYNRLPTLDELAEEWPKSSEEIHKGALKGMIRVREKFTEEAKRLDTADSDNWEHGFNSGCLAMARYLAAVEWGEGSPKESFPELDT